MRERLQYSSSQDRVRILDLRLNPRRNVGLIRPLKAVNVVCNRNSRLLNRSQLQPREHAEEQEAMTNTENRQSQAGMIDDRIFPAHGVFLLAAPA
jgi:hypothetical protein